MSDTDVTREIAYVVNVIFLPLGAGVVLFATSPLTRLIGVVIAVIGAYFAFYWEEEES